MLNRSEFEYLEGVFHDGLGTYFVLLVANQLIAKYGLPQSPFDSAREMTKMESALSRLAGDPRQASLRQEIEHIRSAAAEAAILLHQTLAGQIPREVQHCAGQYVGGLAADLRLIVPGREDVPVSLKTDKSGKVALADIGQTSNLYKWFSELFMLDSDQVERVCFDTMGLTLTQARLDFQNIARLVQVVVIERLGLRPASVNNLGQATPANLDATSHLIKTIKYYKSGHDRAIVLVADRRTGSVRGNTRIDEVDPETLDLSRVSFTPSSPRSHYRYGSTIGVKYNGLLLFDFQVKHQRGKGLTAERRVAFRDITTRLR